MVKFFKISSIIFILSVLIVLPAKAYYSLGQPAGYVTDLANILSSSEKSELEAIISDYEIKSEHEIAVVTIDSLEGDTIENFANRLFREWGIGKKENDNGVLLLVALKERQMRIEVGYGLEGALTDLESGWILDNEIKSYFRQEAYYEGLKAGVSEIIRATEEEIFDSDYAPLTEYDTKDYSLLFSWILFYFYLLTLASGFLASSRVWWPGGVIGLIAGGITAWATGIWWVVPFFIVIGLIFDMVVSYLFKRIDKGGRGDSSGKSGSWWSSSGSGGSSGGGGASSSW